MNYLIFTLLSRWTHITFLTVDIHYITLHNTIPPQVIFVNFKYSEQTVLPPNVMRNALAKTFISQRKFQIGLMDDAAECFVSEHTSFLASSSSSFASSLSYLPPLFSSLLFSPLLFSLFHLHFIILLWIINEWLS